MARHPSLPMCGAKKSTDGKPCRNAAGQGTDHYGFGRCKNHGGATEAGRKSAIKQEAREMAANYGLPVEVDPGVALLQEVYRTAGHVAFLQQAVGEMGEHEMVGPVGREGIDDQGIESHPRTVPSVWLNLYMEERQHLARVCKMALDVGIAERQVRIAEQQGELLAGAIRLILEDLGVADHPDAPKIVRRHLVALPSGVS